MEIQPSLFVKMVMNSWETQCASLLEIMDRLTDEQLMAETAPGRNTGQYIVGHLTAITDGMIPLLGFGEKLFPDLEKLFVELPDKSGQPLPSISTLKTCFQRVNDRLSEQMQQLTPEAWFSKHEAISDEDFSRQPHRCKLNIIINRSNHMAYHVGQLVFLTR